MNIHRIASLALWSILTTGCPAGTVGDEGDNDAAHDGGAADVAPGASDIGADAVPRDAQPTDLRPPDAMLDGSAEPDAALAPTTLENVAPLGPCENPRRVYPLLPDEAGHWALERLVPTTTPAIIDRIQYQLLGTDADEGPHCRSGLPHRIQVFVAPDGPPPQRPSRLEQYRSFATTLDEGGLQAYDLPLDPPVTIREGDALFVALEMVADLKSGTSICIGACQASVPERSYWSNAVEEPYPWGDLVEDFGLADNYTIRALGMAPR